MIPKILVADDEASIWVQFLKSEMTSDTFVDLDLALTPRICEKKISQNGYAVVLLDIRYGSNQPNGFDLIDMIKKLSPSTKIVMFSNSDDSATMLRCRRLRVGYLSKSRHTPRQILSYLSETAREESNGEKFVSERDQRLEQGQALAAKVGAIFSSDEMKDVFAQAVLAQENPRCHVLLLGEPGVGKELIARAISRSDLGIPFETLNCAGMTDSTLQSELFGHEKGAFTGAAKKSVGRIGSAAGGDIFLDELGELSPKAQATLLRAVEYGETMSLGSTTSQKIDFRVIAATNLNLQKAITTGGFRQDLYDRLSILEISIPPLRERLQDVYPILANLLEEENRGRKFSTDCVALFESYSWPGNIRELVGLSRQMMAVTNSPVISICDISDSAMKKMESDSPKREVAQEAPSLDKFIDLSGARPYNKVVGDFERELIRRHIDKLGGRFTQTALSDSLGLPRTNLRRKLDDLQIDLPL